MADRVIMELEGLMLERLINRALADGCRFLRIIRLTRRRISVTGDPKSMRILHNMAEKYRIKCTLVDMHGLCSLAGQIKRRWTLASALLMMVLICWLYLSHIWSVDIRMLRGDMPPGETETTLDAVGISWGASWHGTDTKNAAMQLSALPGCAHASVRREGVTAVIELAMEEPSPALYEMEDAHDIVALCDGVIASVNVKNGTAMVKPGDTVKRGQVLISGYERSGKESFSELAALGSVTARIWYEGEAEAERYELVKRYTGQKSTSAALITPWLQMSLTTGDMYENCDVSVSRSDIGGLFVPIYVEKTLRCEYVPEHIPKAMSVLKPTLEAASYASAMTKIAENAPENAEIIDKWTDFSMIESEDIIYARTVVEVEAEIAVTRGYLEGYQVD